MYKGDIEGDVSENHGARGDDNGPYHPASSHAEAWLRMKRRLRAELGEDVFTSWFGRLELDNVDAGIARLTVPTRFLKSWIESHYTDRVLTLFACECPDIKGIELAVRGSSLRAASVAAQRASEAASRGSAQVAMAVADGAMRGAAAASAPARAARQDQGDLTGNPLDARLTFDSFVLGRSNALAHAAAERIARHESGVPLYNPALCPCRRRPRQDAPAASRWRTRHCGAAGGSSTSLPTASCTASSPP